MARLAQLGKSKSALPLMEAGVSESSSKGRYVSSTPFSTVTYCLSELSILHQSRYSLLPWEGGGGSGMGEGGKKQTDRCMSTFAQEKQTWKEVDKWEVRGSKRGDSNGLRSKAC